MKNCKSKLNAFTQFIEALGNTNRAAKREVIHSNQQKPNFLGSTMYKKKDVSGQFVLKSDLEKGYYKIE